MTRSVGTGVPSGAWQRVISRIEIWKENIPNGMPVSLSSLESTAKKIGIYGNLWGIFGNQWNSGEKTKDCGAGFQPVSPVVSGQSSVVSGQL
jgi:hypothetical protein